MLTPRTLVEAMVKNDVPRDEALHRLQDFCWVPTPESATHRGGACKTCRREDASGRGDSRCRRPGGGTAGPVPAELWPTPTDDELAAAKEGGVVAENVDHTHDFQLAWPSLNFRSDEVEKVAEALAKITVAGVAPEGPRQRGHRRSSRRRAVVSPARGSAGLGDHAVGCGTGGAQAHAGTDSRASGGGGHSGVDTADDGARRRGTQLNEGVVKAAWDKTVPADQWYRKSVIGLSIVVGVGMALKMLRSVQLAAIVLGSRRFRCSCHWRSCRSRAAA